MQSIPISQLPWRVNTDVSVVAAECDVSELVCGVCVLDYRSGVFDLDDCAGFHGCEGRVGELGALDFR